MAFNKRKGAKKVNKAYKYRMYPTKNQGILIDKTLGCTRFIYNHLLDDRIKYYKETGKTLNKEVSEYKEEYKFLSEVDSLALSNAKQNLQTAFENFFEGKAKYPTFHKKGRNDSYTTNNQKTSKSKYSIELLETGVKLPKLGVVKIKQHRPLKEGEVIKKATISKKAGKYYISITVEFDPITIEEHKPSKDSKVIGYDYSSPLFYVDSNGNSPKQEHFYREAEERLAKEQRRLSRKEKNSKNYQKQLKKVQKCHAHIANQRKDRAFKLAHEEIEKYDIFVFEDLNLSNMKRLLKLGKATSDNGFGMFRTIMEQKCKENGKLFIKIDKWYPSSKKCNHCGHVHKDLSLNDREWACPNCNTLINRDHNAAKNIKEEGLRIALS